MRKFTRDVIVAVVFLFAIPAWAHPAGLRFDVASIKPVRNRTGSSSNLILLDGGIVARNTNIEVMIANAFELRSFQILGAPDWVKFERYDVEARTDGGERVNPGQRRMILHRAMVRSLLAERFQLKAHEEERETAVYELVVRKGGPKMKESADDERPASRWGRGQYAAKHELMIALAANLSNWAGRPVIDKTGLSGNYDFELSWEMDGADPTASQGPSLSTAVQEQLGLKLEPAKRPMKVLVVDRIERPSEN